MNSTNKTKQLNIRLTEEQEKKLIKKASEVGLSKGEYARLIILNDLKKK